MVLSLQAVLGWAAPTCQVPVIETFWELGSPADFPPRFPWHPHPLPGIRSWDVDPGVCSLDEQLKVFVSRHSATFSSIVKGEAGHPGAPAVPCTLIHWASVL